jgi:site-specific DNA recombinase
MVSPQALARARLKEIEQSTRRLVEAIEAGADPDAIKPRLAELRAERRATERELAKVQDDRRLTGAEIAEILSRLGGLAAVLHEASPSEKAEVYRSLGLQLSYQPDSHTLQATADLAGGVSRVGGGT